MIKNNFRILKKPHAHLQTILKTPVKFQKDRTKTVGGVKGTKYLLKIRNHALRTTHHRKPKTVSLCFSSKRQGTIRKYLKMLSADNFIQRAKHYADVTDYKWFFLIFSQNRPCHLICTHSFMTAEVIIWYDCMTAYTCHHHKNYKPHNENERYKSHHRKNK